MPLSSFIGRARELDEVMRILGELGPPAVLTGMLGRVSVSIDHLALPSRDAAAAARWLAEILGLGTPVSAGPEGDLYTVALSGISSVVFSTEPSVPSHHVAFAVDQAAFSAVIERLRQRGLSFGNEPEDPSNGATSDPLGGLGRVYFSSPDGHFLEVTINQAT
jgi:catechol 2,3-dioxygenase-like lactoylglutathione lyase family enzyme